METRPGTSAPASVEDAPTPQPPQHIDRYQLRHKIGAGSMGEVYAAYDPELDRTIAIKILHPRLNTRDSRRRLQREAQAMAKLSHPHVVTVHDVGTLGEDIFVAMEWIRDGDLSDRLRRRPGDWREVLELFLQAGRGLQAAHDAGLVHRDFKPENVLIDRRGRAQVTDFGLARPALEDADPSADGADSTDFADVAREAIELQGDDSLTATGALVGTPAYMAPELFKGESASHLTDQFAFCVALWQAVYGRRPFNGKTLPHLMAAILKGTIVEPQDSK
ncbi:MAG: serine/threonine-protein kinase, partial [Acidobacteriota bacterium]